MHRPPRDPAPGGLIERFCQTLQGQLEADAEKQQHHPDLGENLDLMDILDELKRVRTADRSQRR